VPESLPDVCPRCEAQLEYVHEPGTDEQEKDRLPARAECQGEPQHVFPVVPVDGSLGYRLGDQIY
jgi:hypothetical protein